MWGATHAIPDLGLEWRVLFPVYMVIAVIAILWLGGTHIEEEQPDRASGFADCFRLLGHPFILLCFLGIMCHVGIDVGTNTTAPKLLMERLEMTLDEASWATSLYFIFRTLGCLSGTFILSRFSSRSFLWVSVGMMLLAMVGLLASDVHYIIYICIALIGFGNSNSRGGDDRRRAVSGILCKQAEESVNFSGRVNKLTRLRGTSPVTCRPFNLVLLPR